MDHVTSGQLESMPLSVVICYEQYSCVGEPTAQKSPVAGVFVALVTPDTAISRRLIPTPLSLGVRT